MEARKFEESQVFGYALGQVIGRLRQQRGWTQLDLAHRAGISQPMISRIESGKRPDAYVYGRLASAFSLSVQQLDHYAQEAVAKTKQAAEAVSKPKPWQEALAVVGTIGIIGLVAFAVAAMLGDDEPEPPEPS